MATQVTQGGGATFVSSTAVGTATAITLALPVPATGMATVIDSISYSYQGATQTNNSINIQDAGGGTTYWNAFACGPVTGLGTFEWTFPGGLKLKAGQAVEFTAASMANCSQRVTVTGHSELADRTT